jgi:hypothetical protein
MLILMDSATTQVRTKTPMMMNPAVLMLTFYSHAES